MERVLKDASIHMLRHYRSDKQWFIPHSAGTLSIVLEKCYPLTYEFIPGITTYRVGKDSMSEITINSEEEFQAAKEENNNIFYDPGEIEVLWVLPSGEIIEGMSVEAEVEEGVTLCLCSDFRGCSLESCSQITQCETRDLPPFQGHVKFPGFREAANLAELHDFKPVMTDKRNFVPGVLKIGGTKCCPSIVKGTIADINKILCYPQLGYLDVAYAPNITGDLAELGEHCPAIRYNVNSSLEKVQNPYMLKDGTVTRDPFEVYYSFHHCGVYGVPNIPGSNEIYNWTYYSCPNATAQDYDDFLDKLMHNFAYSDSYSNTTVGFLPTSGIVYAYCYEAGQPLVPPCGTLKISNKTNDAAARAEKLAILVSAGWTVEEMEDDY